MKKEIDFRRFANRQILKEIHEHQEILTREINKKACAQLDWVSRLTYNFENNYGSFLYILE
jgi:hypothetical protein